MVETSQHVEAVAPFTTAIQTFMQNKSMCYERFQLSVKYAAFLNESKSMYGQRIRNGIELLLIGTRKSKSGGGFCEVESVVKCPTRWKCHSTMDERVALAWNATVHWAAKG